MLRQTAKLVCASAACCVLIALPANLTVAAPAPLDDIRSDSHLTPESFIKYFADFKFELGRDVRSPAAFLQKRSGDCDDFATLADTILREKGYKTRLVVVYMPNAVHVVCYVAEINGYLDFNRRKEQQPLMKCQADLSAIGASVASSFRCDWRSASEFTMQDGVRNFTMTEFR